LGWPLGLRSRCLETALAQRVGGVLDECSEPSLRHEQLGPDLEAVGELAKVLDGQ